MGLITTVLNLLFGGGRNLVSETAHVFRENAEGEAVRAAAYRMAALNQFGTEFAIPRRGGFDRFMDGLNRVPRPAMALGSLGLLVAAMADPVWFAARMQGIALVPEPLWWLTGAIVSFYFGARHQAKGQEFQRSIAETLMLLPSVSKNLRTIDALHHAAEPAAAMPAGSNAALADWRASRAQ